MKAWWFAPAPAERLAALRMLIGGFALYYVIAALPELHAIAQLPAWRFAPVGIVRAMVPPSVVVAIAIATCVALVAMIAGLAYRVTAPLAAIGLLWTLTYRCTWGQVFHTDDLLVLHVIALACAPAADVWALRTRPKPAGAGYGWPIKLLAALTAATYLLAGIAKLRLAGLHWIAGDLLRNQIAIDNLRKAVLGDHVAPLATLLLDHHGMLAAASVLTLVVELGAPLALLGGWLARGWIVAAWAFHVAIVLSMNITFQYPLYGFAFLPLLRCERPFVWLRDLRRTGMPGS